MAVASVATTPPRDLITGAEVTPAQLHSLLQLAAEVKAHPERFRGALSRKFLALLFEKPSLRTRVSFEIGMQSLGGGSVFLDYSAARMSERETVKDLARNLERWVHVIAARTSCRARSKSWRRTRRFQ